jgi:LAS superfamily LD-carboxypeptidase LdcB
VSATLFAVVCALIVALASFITDLAHAAATKARVQTAADAAALAAVAESTPYGRDLQEQIARRYAEANGAHLVSCMCADGATAVQVTAAIGGATASARAVVDPTAFAPAATGVGVDGLNPELSAAVDALIKASSGRVYLVSGLRSSDRQAALWAEALKRYGSPEIADNWVAPPGHSMHERGLAVDLGGDLSLALKLIGQLDLALWRPMSWEPWHFELTGSRG